MVAGKYVFPQVVKEIRFHLSQTSESSAGLRNFIAHSYPVMKKNNPKIPILIREAQSATPQIFARFEQGLESKAGLADLDEKEIAKKVEGLIKGEL